MRSAIAVLGVAACLFLIQATARIGFSRLLSRYALISNSLPAADEAVRLSPSDPDAHRTRASVFNGLGRKTEAGKSLEAAISLRYRDDYLWLELGNTREELGDSEGALGAFDQGVRWAPHYAHTHWQRGNLLLRMNRTAEAFVELRYAADANRNYLPSLIDLAWGITREDAKAVEQSLELGSDADRLAFLRFLARKGKGKEVVDRLGIFSAPLPRQNRQELSRLLFSAKAFDEAFTLWAESEVVSRPALFNSGFEEPPVLSHAGFGGWVVTAEQTKTRSAIDVSEKSAGKSSLKITFDGEWNPGAPLLAQTIVVEPSKKYRISFSVKAKELVTGGLPMFTVTEAGSDELLGKSENFPSATSEWLKSSFEFTTLATSEAAVLRLRRNNCEPSPCPIFGVLWLDEISIEQID